MSTGYHPAEWLVLDVEICNSSVHVSEINPGRDEVKSGTSRACTLYPHGTWTVSGLRHTVVNPNPLAPATSSARIPKLADTLRETQFRSTPARQSPPGRPHLSHGTLQNTPADARPFFFFASSRFLIHREVLRPRPSRAAGPRTPNNWRSASPPGPSGSLPQSLPKRNQPAS
jgi:hypothetical protein